VGKAARALAAGCQPLLVPDYAPISSAHQMPNQTMKPTAPWRSNLRLSDGNARRFDYPSFRNRFWEIKELFVPGRTTNFLKRDRGFLRANNFHC
jgi:hypothetical protein